MLQSLLYNCEKRQTSSSQHVKLHTWQWRTKLHKTKDTIWKPTKKRSHTSPEALQPVTRAAHVTSAIKNKAAALKPGFPLVDNFTMTWGFSFKYKTRSCTLGCSLNFKCQTFKRLNTLLPRLGSGRPLARLKISDRTPTLLCCNTSCKSFETHNWHSLWH